MTEPERDALYAKVFATPYGKLVLADLEKDYPMLVQRIRAHIARMRERWATGAPKAVLTPGLCPECGGKGEVEGWGLNDMWKCLTCDGTGKVVS